MKIAVFADLHLNSPLGTPQSAMLDWALETINASGAKAALLAGDITACGDLESCIYVHKILSANEVPVYTVPGNSELRSPGTACVAERLFAPVPGGVVLDGVRIVGINASHDGLSMAERERMMTIGREPLILFSHQACSHMDPDSKAFMTDWLKNRISSGQKIYAWFSGHVHGGSEYEYEGVRCAVPNAIDPDKCIGGPPEVLIFDTETEKIESITCTRGLLPSWSMEERQEFADALGITLYHLKEDLRFAIDHGVRHLELRSLHHPDEETIALIKEWRGACGKTLSMHLAEMAWDHENGCVTMFKNYADIVETAVSLGVEFATVHPPYESCSTMSTEGRVFDALADAMAEKLRPLYENGVMIVVENNHTKAGDSSKCEERKFGCGPMELFAWRDALNARLGRNACKIRLDIGHARNNMPVSMYCPLGNWYALAGQDAYTYHMHQTRMYPGAKMKNHFEIDGLDTGLVSFHGFMQAWKAGVLRHGPIILEIREDHKAPDTYLFLRNLLLNGGKEE